MTGIAAFSDLRDGQEIPTLEVEVDRQTLVKYAGASDDYAFQHWDHPRMTGQGFPDVVVHGWLTFGYICRAVTDWASPEIADIQGFAVRYRRPTYPGKITCGGRVTRVREENGRRLADLDLWARNGEGEVTTTATMTLAAG
jgi:acyl dehydratase